MHYEGRIIRPPSEADSILLQVTTGCSHNKCTFCGAYKDKRFSIKPDSVVLRDLEYAAEHYSFIRRLFLCDGDALIIPQSRLLRFFEKIREYLPKVTRISSYASAKALAGKSDQELRELKYAGLETVYMGLESGDDQTLAAVCKHGNAAEIVRQGIRAGEAGMKRNVTVILGLAGQERSMIHAKATGDALTEMAPEQSAALTLMLVPGTELYIKAKKGEFALPDAEGMLHELYILIRHIELGRGLFFANHASNYLSIRARLPRDKEKILQQIRKAMAGDEALRPDSIRRL